MTSDEVIKIQEELIEKQDRLIVLLTEQVADLRAMNRSMERWLRNLSLSS